VRACHPTAQLVEAVPPIHGKRGRPRHLNADRSYDHDACRDRVRAVQITPHIAWRGTEHGFALGVYRWVAERAGALLHWFRRLGIHWEIRDDIPGVRHPRLRHHLLATPARIGRLGAA
jgi:hypothetical protein